MICCDMQVTLRSRSGEGWLQKVFLLIIDRQSGVCRLLPLAPVVNDRHGNSESAFWTFLTASIRYQYANAHKRGSVQPL